MAGRANNNGWQWKMLALRRQKEASASSGHVLHCTDIFQTAPEWSIKHAENETISQPDRVFYPLFILEFLLF